MGITFFQVISLLMILIILIITMHWLRTDKPNRYMWLLILIWMLHDFLFYTVLLLTKVGVHFDMPIRFTDWSSILRNHTVTTVFTIVIGRILYRKTLKK